MIRLAADLTAGSTVLCLGAHCDDIEIGCSGALMELQQRVEGLKFVWVVLSSEDTRESETRKAAERVHGKGDHCQVFVHGFRGSYFPSSVSQIKDVFEALRKQVRPDLIFSHHLADRHQDHRVMAELTWNTFRNHMVLEYEISKYEGDLGHPNCFFPLSESVVERKIAMLMECFPSQLSRTWFDADLFRGLMRLRGVECNAESRFAEAFHVRKFTI